MVGGGGATPEALRAPGLLEYPLISTINGGPPFHRDCVHVLTPFVERLGTEEERKRGDGLA